jgi:TRAP-type uncharacterized transport system substrate-binding protein
MELSLLRKKTEDIKAVTLLGYSLTGFISIDPTITTMADLEGKRVAIGLAPDHSRNTFPMEIVKEYGLTNVKFQELDYQPAADALRMDRLMQSWQAAF